MTIEGEMGHVFTVEDKAVIVVDLTGDKGRDVVMAMLIVVKLQEQAVKVDRMVRGKIIADLSLQAQTTLQKGILTMFRLAEDRRIRRVIVDSVLQIVEGIASSVFPDIA